MKIILAIILTASLGVIASADDERIGVDATINGKSARLAFDTGTSGALVLFKQGAERLGVTFTNPPADYHPAPGEVAVGVTEETELTLWGTTNVTCFNVFDIPNSITNLITDFDGVIGWGEVNDNSLFIDAAAHSVKLLDYVPAEANAWTKVLLRSESSILTLELPGKDGKEMLVALDTGDVQGITLSRQMWDEWKAGRTNQPVTLTAYYTPGAGLVATEEMWAKEFRLGPLLLTDVPVKEAAGDELVDGSEHLDARLGLAALKRVDLIVDGLFGIAYLQPKKTPAPAYEYNRLGAVFAPRNLQSDDLVAHVLDGSPAYEAGIRNGDILLKVDGHDVTNWRTANGKNHDPWAQPAGTKLKLTLKRGDKTFTTTAVLRNILQPDSTNNSN